MAENIVNSTTNSNGLDVETFETTERKPWNVDAFIGRGRKRDRNDPGNDGEHISYNRLQHLQVNTTLAKTSADSHILRNTQETGQFMKLTNDAFEVVSVDAAPQNYAISKPYFNGIHSASRESLEADASSKQLASKSSFEILNIQTAQSKQHHCPTNSALNDILLSFPCEEKLSKLESLDQSICNYLDDCTRPDYSNASPSMTKSQGLHIKTKKRSRLERRIQNDHTTSSDALESQSHRCEGKDFNESSQIPVIRSMKSSPQNELKSVCTLDSLSDISPPGSSHDEYNRFLEWLNNTNRSSNIYDLLQLDERSNISLTVKSIKTEPNDSYTESSELRDNNMDIVAKPNSAGEQITTNCDDNTVFTDPGIDVHDSITQFLIGTPTKECAATSTNLNEVCDMKYTQLLHEFSGTDMVEMLSFDSVQSPIAPLIMESIPIEKYAPPLPQSVEFPSAKRAYFDDDNDDKHLPS